MKDFIASKATLEVELLDELTQIVEHPSYEISSSNFYKLNTWKHKILENKGLVSCKTKAKVTYDNKVEQHIKINREPLAPYGTMLTIPIKTRASPSIRKPESSTHFLEYGFKRPSRLLPLKALRVFAFNTETPVKIKEFEIIIHIPRDYKVMDYQAIHPAKKKKSTLNFELNNL
ncbi:MAG: hypothetical protein FJW69_09865, partial [Actinobacteria bacterium]|nr:hypothetical protein [Actinomycetota bacterium]